MLLQLLDPKAARQPRARRAAWNVVMPRAIAWVPWSRASCWHRRSCRQNLVSGKGKIVLYFLSLLEFGKLLPPWRGYMLVLEEAYLKMPIPLLPSPTPNSGDNPKGSDEPGTVTSNIRVHLESSVLQTF